jgi:phosphatidylglycerol:prolipoprotein diacylglycerol transferase
VFAFAKMTILGLPLMLWIYLAGLLTHGVLVSRRWMRGGITLAQCLGLYALVLLLAVVGGKVYSVIDLWAYYRNDPGRLLSVAGHGWSGVFIATTLGLALVFRLWGKPVLRMLDSYALYLPVGISIGRIGCLITADGDYGTPTSLPWGMTFKHGYFPTQVPVHPTPIYEILVMLLLFLLLRRWIIDRRADGWTLVIYLVVYGVQRFLMELIRWNREFALGMTLPQWACIGYIIVAAVLAWRLRHSLALADVNATKGATV